MQPSTIFKSNRFRLFYIGSPSCGPAEFVLILVNVSHDVTVLIKKVILPIPDWHKISSHLRVIIVSVLSPLQLWDNLLSTPEKDISVERPTIISHPPPYPTGLFLGNRGQLDLPLFDGRIAEIQQTLCFLPGLLDGGERGADTEPGGHPVVVQPLRLHWGGGGGGSWRQGRWGWGGGRGEDGVVTGCSLYLDDGSHSFYWFGSVPPLGRRRPRPSDSPGSKASALIRGWIISLVRRWKKDKEERDLANGINFQYTSPFMSDNASLLKA